MRKIYFRLRPAIWYFSFFLLIVVGFSIQLFHHNRKIAWETFDFGVSVLGGEMWEELDLFITNHQLDIDDKIDWTPELITAFQQDVTQEFIDETIDANLVDPAFLRIESLYDNLLLYETPGLDKSGFQFTNFRNDDWGYQPFKWENAQGMQRGMGFTDVRIGTYYFIATVFQDATSEELAANGLVYRKIASKVFDAIDRTGLDLIIDIDEELLSILDENNAWAYVYFIKEDSVLWNSKDVPKMDLYKPSVLPDQSILVSVKDVNGNSYKQHSDLFDEHPGSAFRVDVAVPCRRVQRSILIAGFYIGGGAIFISLIAGLGGHLLRTRALRPMNKVISIVDELSGKSLGKRIPTGEVDKDIARLISTFNHLLERLENAFKQQKAFIADTSHELRTPLSILTFDIAEALKKVENNSDVADHLSEAKRETGHISRIVNDLQWLAKNDAGQLFVDKKNIRLDEVLMETLSRAQHYASKSKVKLLVGEIDAVECFGDEKLLTHSFGNLVNNAIKYSQKGEVKLSLRQQESKAVLRVEDNGIGIPEDKLDKIFDRFFRVDTSRSRETGGSGLGLAIAKQIAELHEGTIQVQSIVNKGSTFSIVLPI